MPTFADENGSKVDQVGYFLMRIKQGLLPIPDGVDIVTFVKCDGNPRPETPAPRGR